MYKTIFIKFVMYGGIYMYNSLWWNMFADYGTVELYLLYRMMHEREIKNARDKNTRSGVDLGKFK